ncbi:LysM peptidoglycan-binding domain-containing protein [Thioclava sp. DLFJ4-1]|uniref:LysM peptidoglycan-binding domain-containing protein n=1 Tax=Thioclava sp. DLFJ4-1 TaxID=1915313 RepID=UPI001AF0044D|nr:LysM peptidoglycan-binding domain-containing protein [Thioclava sp. DLFJ4-1]
MTDQPVESTGLGAVKGGAVALLLVVLGLVLWGVLRPVEREGAQPSGTDTTAATGSAGAPQTAQQGDGGTTSGTAAPQKQGVETVAQEAEEAASAVAPLAEEPTDKLVETVDGQGAEASAAASVTGTEMGADSTTAKAAADGKPLAQVQFDALRAAPDGSVTLAGRAEPGAKLDILVDGKVVASTQADGAGSFASLFDLPPADGPRALSLRVTGADGNARDSAETLVLRGQPKQERLASAGESATSGTAADGATDGSASATAPATDGAAMTGTDAGASAATGSDAAPSTPTPPAAPLIADADGARLLAPKSDDLVIDTISFGSGEVARSEGRGAPEGTTLSAYLDDTLVAEAQPGADGRWSLSLPGLGTGEHKLRIDAQDASGKVVARAETGFDQPDEILVASAADPTGAQAASVRATGEVGDAVKVVQIVKGNTLWAIAREVYGDGFLYVRVFDANRDQIRDPDLIYPGQVFNIPAPDAQPAEAAQ